MVILFSRERDPKRSSALVMLSGTDLPSQGSRLAGPEAGMHES